MAQESSIVTLVLALLGASGVAGIQIEFFPNNLYYTIGENVSFAFNLSQLTNVSEIYVKLSSSINHVHVEPSEYTIVPKAPIETRHFNIRALGGGQAAVFVSNSSIAIENAETSVLRVYAYHYQWLELLTLIVGWCYFAAWAFSSYPQMWTNFRRKSVVGFNLDYVSLNMIGHTSYFFFNVGLYWIPTIQEQYFSIHRHGVNPVQLNDVLFSVNAVFATAIHCIQCLIYDRGGQVISKPGRVIIAVILTFLTISLILSCASVITWLEYLYYFSYVKLAITFMKYCPQAYMNYRRKSTAGWSIGFAMFDFTGGLLSILQMILLSYNYDDWTSITGDPSKFGLGAVSVAFDVLFMIQHFCLYRGSKPAEETKTKTSKGDAEKGEILTEKKGYDNIAFIDITTHM